MLRDTANALALLIALTVTTTLRADSAPPPASDKRILLHRIESEYQPGPVSVRVLLPDNFDKAKTYRVIYVLPVEPDGQTKYGDGLAELKKLNVANKHDVLCVAPGFAHWPWYADHPTDLHVRQESHFLKAVIPFVESHYPVSKDREGRLLLGFSKSGWGAWSLLLRHPDLFAKAAAWDAPMGLEKPDKYKSGEVFATQENFETYRIPALLDARAAELRGKPARLALFGAGNFQEQHVVCHAQLERLTIPHVYADGPKRAHNWGSGWVQDAVEFLMRDEKGE